MSAALTSLTTTLRRLLGRSGPSGLSALNRQVRKLLRRAGYKQHDVESSPDFMFVKREALGARIFLHTHENKLSMALINEYSVKLRTEEEATLGNTEPRQRRNN